LSYCWFRRVWTPTRLKGTGAVVRTFTATTSTGVDRRGVPHRDALRTIGVALVSTVLCAVLAVPLALYMAKDRVAPRVRLALVVAVTHRCGQLPGQGVRWRMLFSRRALAWATGYSRLRLIATVVTLTYLCCRT